MNLLDHFTKWNILNHGAPGDINVWGGQQLHFRFYYRGIYYRGIGSVFYVLLTAHRQLDDNLGIDGIKL